MTDLELSPDRAERIRGLVELELQRMLEREGLPGGMAVSEVSDLSGAVMYLDRIDSDAQLATSLAQSISQILRSAD